MKCQCCKANLSSHNEVRGVCSPCLESNSICQLHILKVISEDSYNYEFIDNPEQLEEHRANLLKDGWESKHITVDIRVSKYAKLLELYNRINSNSDQDAVELVDIVIDTIMQSLDSQ